MWIRLSVGIFLNRFASTLYQMTEFSAQEMSLRLRQIIVDMIHEAGGWIGFDVFMAQALYAPELGYYAHGSKKLGLFPGEINQDGSSNGSDFVTAPELSPLFGQALSTQIQQALVETGTREVWEFGAGSGALALQLIRTFEREGWPLPKYNIVDLSGSLISRQKDTLKDYLDNVTWVSEWPSSMSAVVIGNEVLDAMPVKLIARINGLWYEKGLVANEETTTESPWRWEDRLTQLRPPIEIEGDHDYLTEIHPQAESFIRSLADKLKQGAAFFFDYGFPEAHYYHPQRCMGTVMCHRSHRADDNPLTSVGDKDITSHINFTGIAMAAQDSGLGVLGYCNQGRFLINCGLVDLMQVSSLSLRSEAQKLIMEHEMGELFKVIGLYKGRSWNAIGFAEGDKTHTL